MKKFSDGNGKAYVEQMSMAEGKNLVDMSVISKASKIAEVLQEHKLTRSFFTISSNPNIEILYQVPLAFDLPAPNGTEETLGEGKCLIDILVIDYENKTVSPFDLKTTSDDAHAFRPNFIKWKYYLQASFYQYGLQSISKFEVNPFSFIVASTTDIENPLIWTCTQSDLHVGRFGIRRPNSNSKILGWMELSERLKWHKEHNLWAHPYEFYQNKVNPIDVFSEWQK
jgi:hypothetical protein